MTNLSVRIGKLKLSNPVMVASGTFGCAEEFKDLIDPNQLGAIVTKTVTLRPRRGNVMPRTFETPCGLLNSIGLENDGINSFIMHKLPFLIKLNTAIIASIAGESPEEFGKLARILDRQDAVDAVELNISCPNIRPRSGLIAQDPRATYRAVRAVRRNTKKTLISKLSPNVTDIIKIAEAAQEAGSDALSLINTVYAMSIDLKTRKPRLGSIFGGLSGPAIKPIALYAVYRVARRVKLPVIGMGGIMSAQDGLEFMLAGATAISLGTANYINPKASIEVLRGIKQYLIKNKIMDINSLIGALKP